MCNAEQGFCDREAVVYVFGNGNHATSRRLTFVGAVRGQQLAGMTPDGARCADHAMDELEGLIQTEARKPQQKLPDCTCTAGRDAAVAHHRRDCAAKRYIDAYVL